MTWGALYFYYKCPACGKQFKYAIDLMAEFGDDFGKCPYCETMGTYVKEGARTPDDLEYEEVE
ncbi:MAG: excinuclease ATPase subunit [Clostridiales bacterium]|nr:excinuclease ATPase subunit [Clostridiales bacterium]